MTAIGKTAGSLAAEVAMTRQNWKGAMMLVEGPFDYRFFNSRRHQDCQLVLGLGRQNVEGAIRLLDVSGISGVCGLIDDDHDSIIGMPNASSSNLIRTDPRDLEGMLIRSSALDKVVGEFCNQGYVEAFLRSEPPTIRDALIRRSLIFGRIHFINNQGPRVSLDSLKPRRFIDNINWVYDEVAVKDSAVALGVASDVSRLDAFLNAVPKFPDWSLCRGHDLVDILYGGLLRVFGGQGTTAKNVELVLRAGIEESELANTSMMNAVRQWEQLQVPYKLIR